MVPYRGTQQSRALSLALPRRTGRETPVAPLPGRLTRVSTVYRESEYGAGVIERRCYTARVKFAYSQAVRTMAIRIKDKAPDLAVELGANLEYLRMFGRAAALPEVRHRIAGSVFFPDLSEVRTSLEPNNPNAAHVRTLAYFAPDNERIFLAVCGDKSTSWANGTSGQSRSETSSTGAG